MAAVDRAWLLMERRTNPMMVVALIVLEQPLALHVLRDLVARRFLSHPRFRCRPDTDYLGALWQPCEDFELADHVVAEALPTPAGRRQLEELGGRLASTPLDPCRPLWMFHLVERYRRGSAVIVRIHHCYADGIALVRVLLALTDAGSQPSTVRPGSPVPATGRPPPGTSVLETAIESLYEPVASAVENALHEGRELLDRTLHLALHPGDALRLAIDAAGLTVELARTAALADDPRTRLKQPLGSVKRIAWADPLPLEEVRAISHVLGATLNDVIMATLAGALGRYLESTGNAAHGLSLRAAVPVNLRADPAREPALGNRFGLIFVELPVGIADPIQRVITVHRSARALKGSAQPLVTLGLLAAVGNLPAAIEQPTLELFSSKASLVASNLPGPREALLLGGSPISQILFWVPQAGSLGVGVSFLSYRGQLQFGVIADRHVISEPRDLVALIAEEFERLVMLVLLASDALWVGR